MKGYFITGTGTDVGKTLLTCSLAYRLKEQGKNVRAVKPVASGFDVAHAHESDPGHLLAALGQDVTLHSVEKIAPWRYAAPLAPDMAAEDEGKAVDFEALVRFCRKAGEGSDYLLVESAGGVMSPLTGMHTMLDWAVALEYPVIMVAGSYLGTLSHTLTSARAIMAAGLMLRAVVVSESESQPVPAQRTLATLRRFLPGQTRLHVISRLDSSRELWKYVPDPTASVL